MIKSKTKKAASSRFKKAKSGAIKRSKPGAGHLMTGKSTKRKRSLRKGTLIAKADEKRIGRLI